jgi:hypothetical protein
MTFLLNFDWNNICLVGNQKILLRPLLVYTTVNYLVVQFHFVLDVIPDFADVSFQSHFGLRLNAF